MSLTASKIFIILRNSLILLLSVMSISIGLTDTFTHPTRLGQQQRLDTYGRYINAGLVETLQRLIR